MPEKKTRLRSSHIGQLMIVGFDGTAMSKRLDALLTRLQPAGIILFARNIISAAQTWQLLRDCQRCVATPLFTCVDLEGGRVDRFRGVFGPAPAAADVFATRDRALFRRHGRIIGECCRTLGFNTDFAPVLDLAFEASRKVMDSRAVSADPRQVASYAREFLRGLQPARVTGCGKHFPGLGEAALDTHLELPSVKKSFRNLWNEDIAPYRSLRAQLPMVMVSHAAYPTGTRKLRPASLSKKWITDVLKKKIGYRGLIVSDDLEMGGVLAAASIGTAAVEFVRAGGDLCLVCHREDYVLAAYEELLRTAEADRRFAARLAEAAGRVQHFKNPVRKFRVQGKAPTQKVVEKLSRQLWEFSEQVRLQVLNRVDTQLRPRG